jgi:hypothetical protein
MLCQLVRMTHTYPGTADVSKAARELQSSGDAAAAQAQQMMTRFASTYEESMKAQQVSLQPRQPSLWARDLM